MSTRVVDRVDEWDERSFADGYHSLHEFADEGFSGVVRAGGAELFMTKGSVVGIRHGSIEDFADATGTAYESPSPALPLLAIMQETNDEVRAEYYSEKTSISEVDSTLADGGFTGYIELAENVLSGDYYLVYHAGRSMSVGFVGSSSRLIDDDEAFDTANDEVGIYEVRPADVEVVEIPEVEPSGGDTGTDSEASTADAIDDEYADESDPAGSTAESEPAETEDESAPTDEGEGPAASEDEPADSRATTEGSITSTAEAGSEPVEDSDGRTDQPSTAGQEAAPDETEPSERRATPEQQTTAEEQQPVATKQHGSGTSASTSSTRESGGQPTGAVKADTERKQRQPSGKVQDSQPRQSRSRRERKQSAESPETSEPELGLETRAIPSLDPERTSDPDENGGSARADTFGRAQNPRQERQRHQQTPQSDTETRTEQPVQEETTQTGDPQEETAQAPEGRPSNSEETDSGVDPEQIEELQTEIDERDEEIDRLESELDRKTTEYEDAKSQLESVRKERDELENEVERLESELDNLETQFGAATDAERRMTPAEALSGTDVFPRYESKGDATLKKAHGGSNRREDVIGNLRLEKNTQFESANVSVAGQTYDEFLESTLEYRFVNWVVGNLLFEIRETGHEKALKDLYDALPVIDWADLKGTVDVVYTEDGQETRSQESFDIVLRNRMGEPLVVANVNDSREGATESMMENLVRSAERVGQSTDAFAGAFLVTKSFFEPPALETADAATKGGLLSRSKRKSFVNLSRKNGYHLCLVEARNENFTLLVPEL